MSAICSPHLGSRKEAPYFEPAIGEAIGGEMPEPYGLLVRILGTWGGGSAKAQPSVADR